MRMSAVVTMIRKTYQNSLLIRLRSVKRVPVCIRSNSLQHARIYKVAIYVDTRSMIQAARLRANVADKL